MILSMCMLAAPARCVSHCSLAKLVIGVSALAAAG